MKYSSNFFVSNAPEQKYKNQSETVNKRNEWCKVAAEPHKIHAFEGEAIVVLTAHHLGHRFELDL